MDFVILQALGEAGSSSASEVEQDLWEDSRLECLNVLSRWDDIQESTNSQLHDANLNDVWQDTWFMEHMFGHLLRARVKKMIDGDAEQQVLLNFVDAAMTVQEHKQVLEVRLERKRKFVRR